MNWDRIPHTYTHTQPCANYTLLTSQLHVNQQLHNSSEKEEELIYCTLSSHPHIPPFIFNMRILDFFCGNRLKNQIKNSNSSGDMTGESLPFCSSSPVDALAPQAGSGRRSAVCSGGGKSGVGRLRLCLLSLQPQVQRLHQVLVQGEEVRALHHHGKNAEEPMEQPNLHRGQQADGILQSNHDLSGGER